MLLIRLLLYSLIGFFIASCVHELGHLIMSLLHKWEFSLLIVGPLLAQSFGIGLVCILPLPIRTGILFTDGCRFRRLMGKGDKRLEEEALYKISILETTSDDTSLYNIQSIVKPLLISKDYYYRYYANYYLYAKAQEENN